MLCKRRARSAPVSVQSEQPITGAWSSHQAFFGPARNFPLFQAGRQSAAETLSLFRDSGATRPCPSSQTNVRTVEPACHGYNGASWGVSTALFLNTASIHHLRRVFRCNQAGTFSVSRSCRHRRVSATEVFSPAVGRAMSLTGRYGRILVCGLSVAVVFPDSLIAK